MMKCWNDDDGDDDDDDDDHKDDNQEDDDHVAMAIWDEMGRDGMRQTLTMRIKRDLVVWNTSDLPTYLLVTAPCIWGNTHKNQSDALAVAGYGSLPCLALPCYA